jgi:hypothetical protein
MQKHRSQPQLRCRSQGHGIGRPLVAELYRAKAQDNRFKRNEGQLKRFGLFLACRVSQRSIELGSQALGVACARTLGRYLASHPGEVARLLLNNNKLHNQGLAEIARGLALSQVSHFAIANNGISDQGLTAFLQANSLNRCLVSLDLSNSPYAEAKNSFSVGAFTTLGKFIAASKMILSLALDYCGIKEESLQALFQELG